jgi:hypothetical protein
MLVSTFYRPYAVGNPSTGGVKMVSLACLSLPIQLTEMGRYHGVGY